MAVVTASPAGQRIVSPTPASVPVQIAAATPATVTCAVAAMPTAQRTSRVRHLQAVAAHAIAAARAATAIAVW